VLRVFLIAASGLALVCAALLFASGRDVPGLAVVGFWALVIFVGVVFERRRYKRLLDAPPGAGWTATEERFIDPTSGVETQVYFNAQTGERAYVKV
jgi:hypothetical protein